MRQEKWDLNKTFKFVRSKRPCVCPNTGFFSQLEAFEKKIIEKKDSKPDSRGKSLPPVKQPNERISLKGLATNLTRIPKSDLKLFGKSENLIIKPLITTTKQNEMFSKRIGSIKIHRNPLFSRNFKF